MALIAFMERHGLKAKPWAEKASIANANAIYNFLNGRSRSLSQPILEKLARAAGVDVAAITGEESLVESLPRALRAEPVEMGAPDLPVFGRASGSTGQIIISPEHEPVTYIPRPPQLIGVEEAFAVYAAGESMHPMYKAGQALYAWPDVGLRPGSGVLIEKTSDEAIIKEFVRQVSDGLVVKEYRPEERDFKVPFSEIRRATRLLGAVDE